jgi:hypothetical protein
MVYKPSKESQRKGQGAISNEERGDDDFHLVALAVYNNGRVPLIEQMLVFMRYHVTIQYQTKLRQKTFRI